MNSAYALFLVTAGIINIIAVIAGIGTARIIKKWIHKRRSEGLKVDMETAFKIYTGITEARREGKEAFICGFCGEKLTVQTIVTHDCRRRKHE